MNTIDIFKTAISAGYEGDSRTITEIEDLLKLKNKEWEELKEIDKCYFDTDELTNIYHDSAIHFDSGKKIEKIFVGIDTEVQEILLADKLGMDMVFGHHPEGKALLRLADVMEIHREALIKDGVSVNVAERLVEERQDEISRGFHGVNYDRAVRAAELLGISFINIHTPADNLANKFMIDFIGNSKPLTLGDLEKSVLDIEEYKIAAQTGNAKPRIISGGVKSSIGKYFVKFNGGTSGNKKIFKYLENAGISTFICMHLPENQIEEAKKYNINVVVMPHMASDSLGVNLILDKVMEKMNYEPQIVAGSGFTRVDRRKK